jgi:hypothetical protein
MGAPHHLSEFKTLFQNQQVFVIAFQELAA